MSLRTKNSERKMYELITLSPQYVEIDNILNSIQASITSAISEGNVTCDSFKFVKREFWGKRSLAYKINKVKKADYHAIYFEADNAALEIISKELDKSSILRKLILKIDGLPISNPPIMAGLLTSENVENMQNSSREYSEDNEDIDSEKESENIALNWISFKNPDLLLRYISDIYLISPRKTNGLSAIQQRTLSRQIALARFLAILPFTA